MGQELYMVLINVGVQVCGEICASPFTTRPFIKGSPNLHLLISDKQTAADCLTAVAANASSEGVTSLAFSAFSG
jgi:hypothetical protein